MAWRGVESRAQRGRRDSMERQCIGDDEEAVAWRGVEWRERRDRGGDLERQCAEWRRQGGAKTVGFPHPRGICKFTASETVLVQGHFRYY